MVISAEIDQNYMNELTEQLLEDSKSIAEDVPPGPQNAEPSKNVDALILKSVHFRTKDNAVLHHTDKYQLVQKFQQTSQRAVFRRGQPFTMTVVFQRAFDPNLDNVKFRMCLGPNPMTFLDTMAEMYLTREKRFTKDSQSWDLRLIEIKIPTGENLAEEHSFEVNIPPSAPVGLWSCSFVISVKNGQIQSRHSFKNNLYVLFNPWCPADPVFMKSEEWKNEYVLNDTGIIYSGCREAPSPKRWVYGQFDEVVLPSALYVLEVTGLEYSSRGDPVKVVRAIAAGVNSQDENGVVMARWSGNYEIGIAPTEWTGSIAILKAYLESSMKPEGPTPVKFGQCRVFGGVTTSICRALGIACRTVTNYDSAHDADQTLTIDKYLDRNGEEIRDKCNDSIWNYHVWNEAWMDRRDLSSDYGGWQVVDGTPQEVSGGRFRVGPASVEAIRQGDVLVDFDTFFVFTEVSSDVVHWEENSEHPDGFKKIKSIRSSVGGLIITQPLGSDEGWENITLNYKSRPGSTEESLMIRRAAESKGVDQKKYFDIQPDAPRDVKFQIMEIEHSMIGKPFKVTVRVENRSKEKRTVTAILSASSTYYHGVPGNFIKKEEPKLELDPESQSILVIEVQPDEYLDKIVEKYFVKVYGKASVEPTQQSWFEERGFTFRKPALSLLAVGELRTGITFPLSIEFKNPLPMTLTDCKLHIEGPRISKPKTIHCEDVPAQTLFRRVLEFTPCVSGTKNLTVIFTSRQLSDVSGSVMLEVVGQNSDEET